jgi:hypothetical protein
MLCRSQAITPSCSELVYNMSPLRLNAKPVTRLAWPRSVCWVWPVATFHTTTVRSSLMLATLVPSGLNASCRSSQGTPGPWPVTTLRRRPVAVSASTIDPFS